MSTISIIDESLKSGFALRHTLIIKFSFENIMSVVLDTALNEFVAFETIRLSEKRNPEGGLKQSDLLKRLFEKTGSQLGRVLTLIDNNVFTLVPDELFSEENEKKYLSCTHDFQMNETTGIDNFKKQKMKNIFWIPAEVNDCAGKYFLLHNHMHFSSVFLRTCLLKNTKQQAIYMVCDINMFYVVVIKNGEFVLCNACEYRTTEDLVFHTMNIFQMLEMECKTVPLFLSGEAENLPDFKHLISQYIQQVEFLKRPQEYIYCKGLNDLPPYYGSVLFGTLLCAS